MGHMRLFLVLALAVTAGGVLAVGTYNDVQKAPGKCCSDRPDAHN